MDFPLPIEHLRGLGVRGGMFKILNTLVNSNPIVVKFLSIFI